MLDLMSVLSTQETADLSNEAKQKETKRLQKAKTKAKRKLSIQETLGMNDFVGLTVDWIPQETITFWRRWVCQCGETYSGPAYDSNPVWVRLEKMRTHRWNPEQEKFIPLKNPVRLKGRPSCYRRGTYQHLVRHSISYMDTQLWSCPSCKSKVVHTEHACTSWGEMPEDDDDLNCDLSLPIEDEFIASLPGDDRLDLDNPLDAYTTEKDETYVEGRKLVMLRQGNRFALQYKDGITPEKVYQKVYTSPVGPVPQALGRFQLVVPL